MALARQKFVTIERFFGANWLEEGCWDIDTHINRQMSQGFLDNSVEEVSHRLPQLWYRLIWDRMLPRDFGRGSESGQHHTLAQIHRLLTVEYLLAKHWPQWPAAVARDVRNRLVNKNQFEATLYELEVLDNFRRHGHDVQMQVSGSRGPDLRGQACGKEISIECKRLTVSVKGLTERLAVYKDLRDSLANSVRKLGQPLSINIGVYGTLSYADVQEIKGLFRDFGRLEPHLAKWLLGGEGRWRILVEVIPPGPQTVQADYESFDLFSVAGVVSPGDKGYGYIIAVQDHVPFDWSSVVRARLKDSLAQLGRDDCNVVCLEIADLANSPDFGELDLISSGISQFFEHDSQRVSAVLVSISGIARNEITSTYRSCGRAWLFPNARPCVPLPAEFTLPDFDYPRIRLRTDIGDVAGPSLASPAEVVR